MHSCGCVWLMERAQTNMYMMVSTSWGELLLTALVRCLLPIHPLTGAIIAVGFVRYAPLSSTSTRDMGERERKREYVCV